MSANLDRPIAAYSDPGPDQSQESAMQLVQKLLALASAEGPTSPDIGQAMQVLMAGLQAEATRRTAGMNAPNVPPSNETEPFDAGGEGTEATYQPTPGAEFTNLG